MNHSDSKNPLDSKESNGFFYKGEKIIMTEQEALKDIIESGIEYGAGDYVMVESLKVAANALKEIQQLREFKQHYKETLTSLLKGEWVDTELVEKYLDISFKEGLKIFDFSRTAEWNKPPLDGQKITTHFRLKTQQPDKHFMLQIF